MMLNRRPSYSKRCTYIICESRNLVRAEIEIASKYAVVLLHERNGNI